MTRPGDGEPGTTGWRLRLGSEVVVEGPGGERLVPGRKASALLAYLAIEGPTPRWRLADLLWPLGRSPRNSLRQAVHALRRRTAVLAGSDPLRIAADVSVVDEDEELLADRDLDDCPLLHDWLAFQVERRRAERIERYAREADAAAADGRPRDGLAAAMRALDLDRYSEASYRRVMRTAYLAGDRAAALDAYHRCVRMLSREFGVRPLPETVALARDVEAAEVDRAPAGSQRIPATVARPPALAGRAAEWMRIEDAWAHGQVVYLSGPSGVGKTRLMHDFAEAKVPRSRRNVVRSRPGDASVPYASQARALQAVLDGCPGLELTPAMRRELSRLVPGLADTRPPPMTTLEEKRFFYATVAEVLRRSVDWLDVALVDDWQYVDAASLEMAGYLFSRITPQASGRDGQYVLGTFRTHEASAAFDAFLGDLTRSGTAVRVELGPLSEDAVAEMLASTAVPGARAFAPTMHRLTGGNPLFVVETLKGLLEAGDLDIGELVGLLPARVAEVLELRFRRLGPAQARFLQFLAVAENDASPALARAVLRVDDQGLASLRTELEAAHLIGGLAFAHDLVHETVRATTPGPIRALLHHRTAEALLGLRGAPARIAHHFDAAGEPEAAWRYRFEAAEEAQVRGAFAQAATWYGQVRDGDPSPDRADRAGERLAQLDGVLEGG